MSIPNLFHKIKSKIDIDKTAIMYLFIIIGVGMGAFGLGRLSLSDIYGLNSSNIGLNDTNSVTVKEDISNGKIVPKEVFPQEEKRYVASKNGKMYYSIGCSGASRINEENKVWFSTATDAEKSGFVLASACK